MPPNHSHEEVFWKIWQQKFYKCSQSFIWLHLDCYNKIYDDQDHEKFSTSRSCYQGASRACRQFQLAPLVFPNNAVVEYIYMKYCKSIDVTKGIEKKSRVGMEDAFWKKQVKRKIPEGLFIPLKTRNWL